VTGDAAVGAATDLRCDVGVDVVLQQVRVVVGGHQVLDGVDLHLRPGEHVAVVGASGAGKSTLAGLLLGWYRPAGGRLLVDGRPLTAAGLRHLRRQTAWVDPQVQLWNRSLVDNLRYGAPDAADAEVHAAITTAHLDGVIGRLPQGIRTPLGDGGALLSGGEGQRVRFGRALLRGDARLVVLDEPFRGLARAERSELLVRAREVWRASTMLCVTHDVVDTRGFDRVIVIDGGAVVEEGVPGELLRRPRSRYATLVGSQSAIRDRMGRAGGWREVRLTGGRLETVTREVDDACAV
jgi:ATP-binding cassette subfamily B protein